MGESANKPQDAFGEAERNSPADELMSEDWRDAMADESRDGARFCLHQPDTVEEKSGGEPEGDRNLGETGETVNATST